MEGTDSPRDGKRDGMVNRPGDATTVRSRSSPTGCTTSMKDFAIFPSHKIKKNVYLKKNVVQIKHTFDFCMLFHLLDKNFM